MGKRTQPSLPVISVRRDCSLTGEEGEDDARSACPLMSRAAHVIQWLLQRDAIPQGGANPYKTCPSSDCGLQLAHMKSESLVIADQHAAVNTFPSLVLTNKCAWQLYNPVGLNPTLLTVFKERSRRIVDIP